MFLAPSNLALAFFLPQQIPNHAQSGGKTTAWSLWVREHVLLHPGRLPQQSVVAYLALRFVQLCCTFRRVTVCLVAYLYLPHLPFNHLFKTFAEPMT
jgi:hypothetical protein